MKNLAPLKLRVLSFLIDWFLGFGLGLIPLLMVFSVTKIEELFGAVVWAITSVLLMGVLSEFVFIIFPITKLGGTFGKYVTGLEIVDEKGNWLSWRRAIFRNYFGYMVSGLVLWTGFWWALRDANRQTWHDMMTGTFVVQKRAWAAVGAVVLIVVLAINVLLVMTIIEQAKNNIFLYKKLFDQLTAVSKELDAEQKAAPNEFLKVSPTPTILPAFPTPMGKRI